MAINTKLSLYDGKFEQLSGETLSLCGLTNIYGEMQIMSTGTIDSRTGYQINRTIEMMHKR